MIPQRYSSPRVGLHIYKTRKGYSGYYESGKGSRDSLNYIKNWFKLKIKDKNGKRIVSGYAYFFPWLFPIVYLGCFIDFIASGRIIYTALLTAIASMFYLLFTVSEQGLICNYIGKLVADPPLE